MRRRPGESEAHVLALLAQVLRDLEHRVLRLRDRHPVAGHDDDVFASFSSAAVPAR
jgi:hypothetical protein